MGRNPPVKSGHEKTFPLSHFSDYTTNKVVPTRDTRSDMIWSSQQKPADESARLHDSVNKNAATLEPVRSVKEKPPTIKVSTPTENIKLTGSTLKTSEPPVTVDSQPSALESPPRVTADSHPSALESPPRVTVDSHPSALESPPRVTADSQPSALESPPRVTVDSQPDPVKTQQVSMSSVSESVSGKVSEPRVAVATQPIVPAKPSHDHIDPPPAPAVTDKLPAKTAQSPGEELAAILAAQQKISPSRDMSPSGNRLIAADAMKDLPPG